MHHIISRGIERRAIFEDDYDRDRFVERLAVVLEQTGTLCYAWALIPNHFHLLICTGSIPVAGVMRRLSTGKPQSGVEKGKRDLLIYWIWKSGACTNAEIGNVEPRNK